MVSKYATVDLFGREKIQFLFTPDAKTPAFTVELLMLEISKHLKMKENSMQLFSLHLGSLASPKRILRASEEVPLDGNICFRRFNFDLKQELKLLTKDDVALHLAYEEARSRVSTDDIELSAVEKEDLAALDDPFFPTERQYLEYLIQKCPKRYQTIRFKDCRLARGGVGDIRSGVPLTVLISDESFQLMADGGERFKCSWSDIKCWSVDVARQVASFQVRWEGVLTNVELHTEQPQYMTSCAMLVCVYLVHLESGPPSPQESKLLFGKPVNPLYEQVNKVVFPAANFKKI
jgi:hypothetical protein